MDIVFCTDDNYTMPCGIAMISLLENNRDTSITFHIIGMNLKEESKEKISSIALKYKYASILFYEIEKELLESYNFSLYDSEHFSLAAYSRLFLGDILPKSIDKLLYLDCDIVISKDLSELWNINIKDYSVAGAPDLFIAHYPQVFTNLGYTDAFQYINSGILLINLKYWREQNLINIFLDYYKEKHTKLLFHDQDIINGTLYDTKLLLPIKFNVMDFYYLSKKKNLFQYKDEVYEAIKDPVIIHYTSSEKPWLKLCFHPLRGEFFKYKAISPWSDVPSTWSNISLSKKIRYYKRLIIYALKLKTHKYLTVEKDLKTRKYKVNQIVSL